MICPGTAVPAKLWHRGSAGCRCSRLRRHCRRAEGAWAKRCTTASPKCLNKPGGQPGTACLRRNRTSTFPWGWMGGRNGFGSMPTEASSGVQRSLPPKPTRPDTPRLALEKAACGSRFELPSKPSQRTLEEESLPSASPPGTGCVRLGKWPSSPNSPAPRASRNLVCLAPTEGEGRGDRRDNRETSSRLNPAPPGDTFAVFMAKFTSPTPRRSPRPVPAVELRRRPVVRHPAHRSDGLLWSGDHVRGQIQLQPPSCRAPRGSLSFDLKPHEARTSSSRFRMSSSLNPTNAPRSSSSPSTRAQAMADYWRQRLNASATLISPNRCSTSSTARTPCTCSSTASANRTATAALRASAHSLRRVRQRVVHDGRRSRTPRLPSGSPRLASTPGSITRAP